MKEQIQKKAGKFKEIGAKRYELSFKVSTYAWILLGSFFVGFVSGAILF